MFCWRELGELLVVLKSLHDKQYGEEHKEQLGFHNEKDG